MPACLIAYKVPISVALHMSETLHTKIQGKLHISMNDKLFFPKCSVLSLPISKCLHKFYIIICICIT